MRAFAPEGSNVTDAVTLGRAWWRFPRKRLIKQSSETHRSLRIGYGVTSGVSNIARPGASSWL
jgi:hypothetical protein